MIHIGKLNFLSSEMEQEAFDALVNGKMGPARVTLNENMDDPDAIYKLAYSGRLDVLTLINYHTLTWDELNTAMNYAVKGNNIGCYAYLLAIRDTKSPEVNEDVLNAIIEQGNISTYKNLSGRAVSCITS